jgi:hypothetical protein
LEDFVLDDQGLVVRCANDVAPVSVSAATVKLQARFDLSVCRTELCVKVGDGGLKGGGVSWR